MTDPVYEFVKGQGWVIQVHETYVGIRENAGDGKKYRVTVIRRPPELGERGWFIYSSKVSLKEVFEEVNWQGWGSPVAGFAWYCDSSRFTGVRRDPTAVVTVVTEPLDP